MSELQQESMGRPNADHDSAWNRTLTPPPSRWHWTREDFERLTATGFFEDGPNAELIQGDIYALQPPGPFHSGSIRPIARLLEDAFGPGFHVRTEQPLITRDTDSQPQPDIAVCVGSDADFRRRFPVASEVRLVVEVSDSSLPKDRTTKLTDYAAAGIPEYWIVNLIEMCVEVYRDPTAVGEDDRASYTLMQRCLPGEAIMPLHAPNAASAPILVSNLLGV